jgi:hypothetical protein
MQIILPKDIDRGQAWSQWEGACACCCFSRWVLLLWRFEWTLTEISWALAICMGAPFVHFHFFQWLCPSHTLWANWHALACPSRSYFCRFFLGILPVCTLATYSSNSIFHFYLHCFCVRISVCLSMVLSGQLSWVWLLASSASIGTWQHHFPLSRRRLQCPRQTLS